MPFSIVRDISTFSGKVIFSLLEFLLEKRGTIVSQKDLLSLIFIISKLLKCDFSAHLKSFLTHFSPVSHFYTPVKRQTKMG